MTAEVCKISLKPLKGNEAKPGYNNTAFKNLFGSLRVDESLGFSRADFFRESQDHVEGMSISGVQQKLSLKIDAANQLVPTAEGGQYILKPSPEAFPNAAENEHVAMLISNLVGISTADCGLVAFNDGELAYITRRFDRQDNGRKLHQEDLLQCTDRFKDKYQGTYQAVGEIILEVTNGKLAAVMDLIRRTILAYAIGNDDLHLKNFSVQRLPGNKSPYYDRLTPNYDVLFIQACKSENTRNKGIKYLALDLLKQADSEEVEFTNQYQHYGYYTGYDFIELGKRLGIAPKPIEVFVHKLVKQSKKIEGLIDASYMPEKMKELAKEDLTKRLRALCILTDQTINSPG